MIPATARRSVLLRSMTVQFSKHPVFLISVEGRHALFRHLKPQRPLPKQVEERRVDGTAWGVAI